MAVQPNDQETETTASSLLPAAWIEGHSFGKPREPGRKCAVFYCRYSKPGENEESIERQIELMADYARKLGVEVCASRHLYIDRGISGGSLYRRAALEELLADARKGLFDYVFVEDVDRFARDVADLHKLKRELDFLRIELHAALRGRIREIEAAIYGFLSAEQRLRTSMLTHHGRKQMARQGRFPNGACYGYRRDKMGPGSMIVHEPEAVIVRRIFQLCAQGVSIMAIARVLNEEGVPAPAGGFWRAPAISGSKRRGNGILRNPRYRGVLVYGRRQVRMDPNTFVKESSVYDTKDWIVRRVPQLAIVPTALWNRVQDRLAKPEGAPGTRAERKETFIFKGRVRCSCGASMTALSNGAKAWTRLVCSAALQGACDRTGGIRMYSVECELLDMIATEMVGPEAEEVFRTEFVAEGERFREEIAEARARGKRAITQLVARLKATFDEAFTEGFSSSYLATLRRDLEAELSRQENMVASLPDDDDIPTGESVDFPDLRKCISELKDRMPLLARTEQECVVVQKLRAIVRAVVIERDADGYVLYVEASLGGLMPGGGDSLPSRNLVRRCPKPTYRMTIGASVARTYDVLPELPPLDDSGWDAVASILGELRGWKIAPRTAFEAALIFARTATTMDRMPPPYDSQRVAAALRRFGAEGRLRKAVAKLAALGHPVVEGLDMKRLERWTRPSRKGRGQSAGRSASVLPPLLPRDGRG